MKKRNSRFRAVAEKKKALPVLFNLPEDEQEAQIAAMLSAMDAAVACGSDQCGCKKKRHMNHLDVSGQAFLALYYAQLCANTAVDGKQGVNDQDQFLIIFRDTVPRVYTSFLSYLQRSPHALAVLRSLSEIERLTALNAAAVAQVHLLALPPDEPLSLVWPAPVPGQERQVN